MERKREAGTTGAETRTSGAGSKVEDSKKGVLMSVRMVWIVTEEKEKDVKRTLVEKRELERRECSMKRNRTVTEEMKTRLLQGMKEKEEEE